ncbi:MAG: hypothetical protein ACSHXH_04035 [Marivita sp.]|uniref:hypothetical protein n=1 Tax=Marivita sp. TaxID=2003365 RepID=UPI003EF5AEAE
MSKRTIIAERDAGYLEVFCTQTTGTIFGHRLVGTAPGPQLVVASHCQTSAHVFERLLNIPTLPWMRGNLVLIRLDALDDLVMDITSIAHIGIVDRTMILTENTTDPNVQRRNYHMILRACAQLGMISGRGVAPA